MPELILIHCPAESKIHTILSNLQVTNLQYLNIPYQDLIDSLRSYLNAVCADEIKVNTKLSEITESLTENSVITLYTVYSLLLKAVNMLHSSLTENTLIFSRIFFNEILFISNKTQKELKIFDEKLHPSLVKGKGRSKEGLSIYSIFDKCTTTQGKKLMRHLFSYPVHNKDKLKLRYDMISDFSSLKNYSIVKSLLTELKNIKDMEKMLKELTKFMINFKIWNSLYSSICSIFKVLELFKTQIFNTNSINTENGKFKILKSFYSRLNLENLEKILDFLNTCLDFPKEEYKPKIKIGVNEDLDILRTEYNNLNEILSKHAIEYSKTLPAGSFLDKFMYVFIPQLGYMLAVEKSKNYYSFLIKVKNSDQINGNEIDNIKFEIKKDNEQGDIIQNNIGGKENLEDLLIEDGFTLNRENKCIPEEEEKDNNEDDEDNDEEEIQNFEETQILHSIIFKDINLTFQFHSEDTVYFKNEITKVLDNKYGDLAARITDIENAIFREISKQIVDYSKDIMLSNDFIANLDCYLTCYLIAEKLNLTRPILNLDNSFRFEGGRNILCELVNETKYIKHAFKDSAKNIFIITGNISSGKSTMLREIGMLAYLAQVGSYIPAVNFHFEPFKKILTNIDILESTVDNLSGFTIELKNIKSILDIIENDIKSDNSNTLVLLDDPYRRTSSINRKGLVGGTISYLNKIINLAGKNLGLKIFITCSRDVLDFIIKQKVIDNNMTSLYEMKTGFIKSNSNIITNSIPINLYELVPYEGGENNNLNSDNNLFLARENGLDNNIFLRSYEVAGILSQGRKLFPDIFRVNSIIESFKFQKQFLKLSDNFEELTEKVNSILENKNIEFL
jgi:DNA mismatch repair ATPase MutS